MSNSTTSASLDHAGVSRRVIAGSFDFLIVAGYILLLLAIGLSVDSATVGLPMLASPIAMDILAFFVLVLPVGLYFVLQEASSFQATWGKRRANVKVVNVQGNRLSARQALVRSAVKFLPWQIAPTCVIHIWFGNPSPIFLAGALGAQALVGAYGLCLWLTKDHRTPYDWIARAYVVTAS